MALLTPDDRRSYGQYAAAGQVQVPTVDVIPAKLGAHSVWRGVEGTTQPNIGPLPTDRLDE
jgi:hypothetical protein